MVSCLQMQRNSHEPPYVPCGGRKGGVWLFFFNITHEILTHKNFVHILRDGFSRDVFCVKISDSLHSQNVLSFSRVHASLFP